MTSSPFDEAECVIAMAAFQRPTLDGYTRKEPWTRTVYVSTTGAARMFEESYARAISESLTSGWKYRIVSREEKDRVSIRVQAWPQMWEVR